MTSVCWILKCCHDDKPKKRNFTKKTRWTPVFSRDPMERSTIKTHVPHQSRKKFTKKIWNHPSYEKWLILLWNAVDFSSCRFSQSRLNLQKSQPNHSPNKATLHEPTWSLVCIRVKTHDETDIQTEPATVGCCCEKRGETEISLKFFMPFKKKPSEQTPIGWWNWTSVLFLRKRTFHVNISGEAPKKSQVKHQKNLRWSTQSQIASGMVFVFSSLTYWNSLAIHIFSHFLKKSHVHHIFIVKSHHATSWVFQTHRKNRPVCGSLTGTSKSNALRLKHAPRCPNQCHLKRETDCWWTKTKRSM